LADYCRQTGQVVPTTHAALIRCIFDSLALKYKYVLGKLQHVAPFAIERLHIIGGGAKNQLLNQFTANAIGMPVMAGPSEATAIGNIMMQAKALGVVDSLTDMRALIRQAITPDLFQPQDTASWETAYGRFLAVTDLN